MQWHMLYMVGVFVAFFKVDYIELDLFSAMHWNGMFFYCLLCQ